MIKCFYFSYPPHPAQAVVTPVVLRRFGQVVSIIQPRIPLLPLTTFNYFHLTNSKRSSAFGGGKKIRRIISQAGKRLPAESPPFGVAGLAGPRLGRTGGHRIKTAKIPQNHQLCFLTPPKKLPILVFWYFWYYDQKNCSGLPFSTHFAHF